MTGREELFLNASFRELFRRHGFRRPFDFLHPRQGELLRRLPDRENWLLQLGAGEAARTFFLKCHAPARADPPPGIREWTHHQLLLDLGFPVPLPAAAGQLADGASFFCSLALRDAVPLERHLRDPRHRSRARVRRLADLVRRLHEVPLAHRDLYLCHVFVRRSDDALFLVDLQRLLGRPGGRLRRRWRIKDLAALYHSAALPGVTRTDRLRFLLSYLGRSRTDPCVRRWVRRIQRKARRLGKHVPQAARSGLVPLAAVPSLRGAPEALQWRPHAGREA